MAVTKTIIKNTNQETIVKVGGTAGSATISLATDCLASTQALDGATQTVDIVTAQTNGLLTSAITIVRNSVAIMAFAPENSGTFNFEGNGLRDAVQNTKDIVVTVSGAEAHIYLTLRKIGGYATKVETAQFGSYDDNTVVGS
jgi:phage tail sheath gpL-like